MADTMKFGPEWLRALSDGSLPTGPTPAPSSKFKLAEYRYGREEMLALYQESNEPAVYLQEFPHIYVEEPQTPISLLPLSEDEQRLMAQGVNSQVVMRTGRGGPPPLRGGRGGAVDRGRGRGRGRGEGYTRGAMENGDIGGGFGRPRGPNKDGWEEVGSRKLDRVYTRPYDDVGREGHPRYSRSMSDNWRDKGPADEDDDGDWRKTGNRERWTTRSSWRDPGKSGMDPDRRNGAFTRSRGFESDDRGRHMGEPRASEDVPEWADDGADDVGTFDSSGAFVSYKERSHFHEHREEAEEEDHRHRPGDQPEEREAAGREKEEEEGAEREAHKNGSPGQLSNGTGASPQGSREATLPAVTQQENGVPSEAVSVATAVVSATPVLPSMPQGVTLSNIVMDEKTEAKNAAATSMTDENALKWLYTDPQGEVQGPFLPEEMAQWFSAGYFTMNLLVKRGCDEQFQPLGELMKRWGHVPFLPGPPPPPILQTTVAPSEPAPTSTQPAVSLAPPAPSPAFSLSQGAGGTDSLLVQQQLLLQHQILQLQMGMRQLQMQTLAQLQEQDTFKALDPAQQQQLSMQMMQSNPLVLQHMQQLQQLQHMQQQTQQQQQQQQQISQGQGLAVPTAAPLQQQSQLPQSGVDVTMSTSPPVFQRSVSQPAPSGEGQGDIPSIWGSAPPAGGWSGSQPGSMWELENMPVQQALKSDLDKLRQEKEAEFARIMEAERKRQEEIQKQQEELRRQTEALQREREQMEREKEELERQRQLEMQRVEEIRRQKEEEQQRREREEAEAERRKQQEELNRRKRMEEQRKKEQQQREKEEERRQEEERRRRQQEEEEQRKQEELRRKRETEEKALQEMKRQEELRQQQEAEKQRQREAEKQQEAEAAQRKQQEFQRQQQEALKRLQQQQAMQNIQLPSSANWARQQQAGQSGPSRTLAEIQQEEEMRQLQQERERQQMMRLQAEQLAQQQLQQQQQQQKSWASNLASQQPPRNKSLAEIQEEQERQLRLEKQKVQQQHQHQAKAMSLSQAAVWGSGPAAPAASTSTPWSGGSVWGSDASIGLWGNSVSQPVQASSSRKGKDNCSQQVSAEFPALRSQKSSNKSKQPAAKTTTPVKPKKEEEAVQRLFKPPTQSKDEFTVWCESFLGGMDVQIDIETFVSFLQAVDSPYEVHDYVKNYLGEGKNAREFAKQFLEKRSHYKNKARNEKRQEEESIWGPAPALNPRETRGSAQTAAADHGFTEVGGKSKGAKKKKNKMQKLDCSTLLGFTVEKDPNRKNAGEIESAD